MGTLTIVTDVAISAGTVIALLFLILGGFYARNIPDWLDWLKYFSALRYVYIASLKVILLDYKDINCNANGFYISKCFNRQTVDAQYVIEVFLNAGVLGSYIAPYNILVILGIFVFFRLLAFLSLAYIPIKIGRE